MFNGSDLSVHIDCFIKGQPQTCQLMSETGEIPSTLHIRSTYVIISLTLLFILFNQR